MKTCLTCEYSTIKNYNSGECIRFPPVPIYQRIEWQYSGEAAMGVQSEYPMIWNTTLACGEFKKRTSDD